MKSTMPLMTIFWLQVGVVGGEELDTGYWFTGSEHTEHPVG